MEWLDKHVVVIESAVIPYSLSSCFLYNYQCMHCSGFLYAVTVLMILKLNFHCVLLKHRINNSILLLIYFTLCIVDSSLSLSLYYIILSLSLSLSLSSPSLSLSFLLSVAFILHRSVREALSHI